MGWECSYPFNVTTREVLTADFREPRRHIAFDATQARSRISMVLSSPSKSA